MNHRRATELGNLEECMGSAYRPHGVQPIVAIPAAVDRKSVQTPPKVHPEVS